MADRKATDISRAMTQHGPTLPLSKIIPPSEFATPDMSPRDDMKAILEEDGKHSKTEDMPDNEVVENAPAKTIQYPGEGKAEEKKDHLEVRGFSYIPRDKQK